MRRTAIITDVLIYFIPIVYFVCTEKINSTPYFESRYFKKSCSEADSLAKITFPTYDSLSAGFSKVSITPLLTGDKDYMSRG